MKPDYTKPVDVLAFLQHAFGACGCSDMEELIGPIYDILDRVVSGEADPQDGLFYIVAGILTNWGLIEHGTSIRSSWVTPEGLKLLATFDNFSVDDIEEASGEAYDGLWYGVGR